MGKGIRYTDESKQEAVNLYFETIRRSFFDNVASCWGCKMCWNQCYNTWGCTKALNFDEFMFD